MLFDRVPLLYGSGVIPAKFREIRAAVKRMVMRMFFEREYLERYIAEHAPHMLRSLDLRASRREVAARADGRLCTDRSRRRAQRRGSPPCWSARTRSS